MVVSDQDIRDLCPRDGIYRYTPREQIPVLLSYGWMFIAGLGHSYAYSHAILWHCDCAEQPKGPKETHSHDRNRDIRAVEEFPSDVGSTS